MQSNKNNQGGFTLVELSIVLIIIGLIVGGVLAGQSLIRSARLQADVGNYNKLDAAVNAFNLRYSGLPNDLTNANALFGAQEATIVNAVTVDGMVGLAANAVVGDATADRLSGVTNQLAAAQMISLGVFTQTANASNALNIGIIPARTSGGILLYGANGQNFVRFGLQNNTGAATSSVTASWTPEQLSFIDTKIDDGAALTGIMTSGGAATADLGTAAETTAGATQCNAATTGVYTLANATNTCGGFRIRISS